MSVYVDNVEHDFGNMKMCHLWADTLEELLEMVDKIGVQRKWIQGHPTLSFGHHKNASWVHFDIAKSKKALAMKHGALLTDEFGPLVHVSKLRMASGRTLDILIGQSRLNLVEKARARRAQ